MISAAQAQQIENKARSQRLTPSELSRYNNYRRQNWKPGMGAFKVVDQKRINGNLGLYERRSGFPTGAFGMQESGQIAKSQLVNGRYVTTVEGRAQGEARYAYVDSDGRKQLIDDLRFLPQTARGVVELKTGRTITLSERQRIVSRDGNVYTRTGTGFETRGESRQARLKAIANRRIEQKQRAGQPVTTRDIVEAATGERFVKRNMLPLVQAKANEVQLREQQLGNMSKMFYGGKQKPNSQEMLKTSVDAYQSMKVQEALVPLVERNRQNAVRLFKTGRKIVPGLVSYMVGMSRLIRQANRKSLSYTETVMLKQQIEEQRRRALELAKGSAEARRLIISMGSLYVRELSLLKYKEGRRQLYRAVLSPFIGVEKSIEQVARDLALGKIITTTNTFLMLLPHTSRSVRFQAKVEAIISKAVQANAAHREKYKADILNAVVMEAFMLGVYGGNAASAALTRAGFAKAGAVVAGATYATETGMQAQIYGKAILEPTPENLGAALDIALIGRVAKVAVPVSIRTYLRRIPDATTRAITENLWKIGKVVERGIGKTKINHMDFIDVAENPLIYRALKNTIIGSRAIVYGSKLEYEAKVTYLQNIYTKLYGKKFSKEMAVKQRERLTYTDSP